MWSLMRKPRAGDCCQQPTARGRQHVGAGGSAGGKEKLGSRRCVGAAKQAVAPPWRQACTRSGGPWQGLDAALHWAAELWVGCEAVTTPGVEPGLSRPQRDVLTTRRCGRLRGLQTCMPTLQKPSLAPFPAAVGAYKVHSCTDDEEISSSLNGLIAQLVRAYGQ